MAKALASFALLFVGLVASMLLVGCGSASGATAATTSTSENPGTTVTTTQTPSPHSCAALGCGNHDDSCYCNDGCLNYGDCCDDYVEECASKTTTPDPSEFSCLCIFDIDRTLTAKQGHKECPDTQEMPGIRDDAYDGGTLILSNLALNLENTFCAKCHMGIVTAGVASGPGSPMRAKILELLTTERTLTDHWSEAGNVVSSLVTSAPDTHKQEYVRKIIDWFKNVKNVSIADSLVHFFDDRPINVEPFMGTGFNAREISCASRDGSALGLCGGQQEEAVIDGGIQICNAAETVV